MISIFHCTCHLSKTGAAQHTVWAPAAALLIVSKSTCQESYFFPGVTCRVVPCMLLHWFPSYIILSLSLSTDVLSCAADMLKPLAGSSRNPIALYGFDFVIAKSELQPCFLGVSAAPSFPASSSCLDSMLRVLAANHPSAACEKCDDIVQVLWRHPWASKTFLHRDFLHAAVLHLL